MTLHKPAERLLLYVRTARHLRPLQLAHFVWDRAPKAPLPRKPAPPLRAAAGAWLRPIAKPVGFAGEDRFVFLNQPRHLDFPVGWNDPAVPKLWLYNLHYFDDLCAEAGAVHKRRCEDLMERWVAQNPSAGGNGWEPYPLSLRIVNWIKHRLLGRSWPDAVRDSLAMQVRALEQRVEWRLLANHLFANAKALVFAGSCFEGNEGARWLRKGLRILDREIGEQILPDGGHIERSPMYHAVILEDVLDLVNLSGAMPGLVGDRARIWKEVANKMRRWLAAMSHPDGDIAFFNDCALGVAPRAAALEAYAERLGLPPISPPDPVVDLKATGYACVRAGPFTLFFDAAPIGPDYQPGHAHADTLSIELSVRATRVIVNGGVSTYEPGPERAAERATRSHSTVEVDGQDSSEVWSAFRVARRAGILTRKIEQRDGETLLEASHDGYARVKGSPIPARTVTCGADHVTITDRIDGDLSNAISRFRFAPGLAVSLHDGGCGGVVSSEGRGIAEWTASQPGTLHPIVQAQAFNIREPAREVQFRFEGREVKTIWRALG